MLRHEPLRSAYPGISTFLLFLLAIAPPAARADDPNDYFDTDKLRIDAFWFYSNPSGSFEGSTENDAIDLQKDLHFASYSTFSGKFDWRFTHKNHFYVAGASFDQSRSVVLQRTVVFQGQTFNLGLTVKANLTAPMIAPGYQYDIIRRKRGHLGVAVQVDLFNAKASLFAGAQVSSDGLKHAAVSAQNSLLAPIPVAGPEFRFYITNSPRLFVEGQVFGMYLFGYGNFVSTADDIGVTIVKHLSFNAGYQLGSRLVVKNNSSSNRIGLRLTQSGPIVGLEWSF